MKNRLKDLMDERGLTCIEVAQELDFSRTFVNEMKNNKRPMAYAGTVKVLAIAKYFDVSIEYLLGFTDVRLPYPSQEATTGATRAAGGGGSQAAGTARASATSATRTAAASKPQTANGPRVAGAERAADAHHVADEPHVANEPRATGESQAAGRARACSDAGAQAASAPHETATSVVRAAAAGGSQVANEPHAAGEFHTISELNTAGAEPLATDGSVLEDSALDKANDALPNVSRDASPQYCLTEAEKELFHCYNSADEKGKKAILAAARSYGCA